MLAPIYLNRMGRALIRLQTFKETPVLDSISYSVGKSIRCTTFIVFPRPFHVSVYLLCDVIQFYFIHENVRRGEYVVK